MVSRPSIEFDDEGGFVKIDGVRFGYGCFAALCLGHLGAFMRVEERHPDGTLTLRRFSPDLERQFAQLANLPVKLP